jgi:valyl-tRNA synthetase
MSLPKHYDAKAAEAKWMAHWQQSGLLHFRADSPAPIYSIDTPPPTVSGSLHIGHLFSYTHADAIARYRRMRGDNVFYPMGFDDNGLPTERLAEKHLGIRPNEIAPDEFRLQCAQVSQEAEAEFRAIWDRIGLSVDWSLLYTTMDQRSWRMAQRSFLDLFRQGRIYRQEAPTLWCPECRTAIAQAEAEDAEATTQMTTLRFALDNGEELPIATTRPELLPACVAIFVHPADPRWPRLAERQAIVPLFGQSVPILSDEKVDREKGTGVVMCCTFGDTTDIAWWSEHGLPHKKAIGGDGRMTTAADTLAGMTSTQARRATLEKLRDGGFIAGQRSLSHAFNIHERCGTPLEFLMTPQWFVRILDMKDRLLAAGREITWHPAHMQKRYEHWIENLRWDWCISRQRLYGVPFPLWHCQACGDVILPREEDLPSDPRQSCPKVPCSCGSRETRGEMSVLDTWFTSSLTPQINSGWGETDDRTRRLIPMSLRPQAHDIIRTWAFYTIVKSLLHLDKLPWLEILISGHAVSPSAEAKGERKPKWQKISKSKSGASDLPSLIDRESADAIRYWACCTRAGRDTLCRPEDFVAGRRLATKLYNATRFAADRLHDFARPAAELLTLDRWLLSKLACAAEEATAAFEAHDFVSAKETAERFFWNILADNYIEMAKGRLYGTEIAPRHSAQTVLYTAMLSVLRLLAPITPFITEELYQFCFAHRASWPSIHAAPWPHTEPGWRDPIADRAGDLAVTILEIIRRHKTETKLSAGTEIGTVRVALTGTEVPRLEELLGDLASAARAKAVELVSEAGNGWEKTRCGVAMVSVELRII